MSTVDYIAWFADALENLINYLVDFFNKLTGKAPIEEEKKEEENLPL